MYRSTHDHHLTAGAARERRLELRRFGGRAELRVQAAPAMQARAQDRLERAAALLAEIDARLSRFNPASELSRLNADPRERVPASPLMLRFAESVGWAGRRSGGLVDATVLPAVERAGYRTHLELPDPGAPGQGAFADQPAEVIGAAIHAITGDDPAGAPTEAWRHVHAGPGHIRRPPGARLDSGGLGKGLAADLAADLLRGAPAWLVDCGGDLRIGGTARVPRAVDVRDPVDPESVVHRLHVTSGAVATSGVTRRAWTDGGGARQHHLIDPRTGEPADTGLLQVTALAPTALEAEVLAKVALLTGPAGAHRQLEHGGVIIAADGLVTIVPPPAVRQAARRSRRRATVTVPGRPTVLHAFGGSR